MNNKGLDYAYEQVKTFHEAFYHPTSEMPCGVTPSRANKRAKWMVEEIDEFLDAVEAKDLTEQADAMIDLIYFALGTLVEMGVRPQALFDIVQNANMAKLWSDGKPHFREDGKVIKPDGWQDPHTKLTEEIERQKSHMATDIMTYDDLYYFLNQHMNGQFFAKHKDCEGGVANEIYVGLQDDGTYACAFVFDDCLNFSRIDVGELDPFNK